MMFVFDAYGNLIDKSETVENQWQIAIVRQLMNKRFNIVAERMEFPLFSLFMSVLLLTVAGYEAFKTTGFTFTSIIAILYIAYFIYKCISNASKKKKIAKIEQQLKRLNNQYMKKRK